MNLSGKIIKNRYRIEQMICEDSFSYLHDAVDIITNDRIISARFLKNSAISSRTENIIRFRTEIYRLLENPHQNLVQILDIGEAIGLHYLIREQFGGNFLSLVLSTERFPISKSVEIIMQICNALEHLHINKIIHRAIIPRNIIIYASQVKLDGVGTAHIREFTESTTSQEIIDTIAYLSPEQNGMTKGQIDERSDLYSVGILLYRLITGQLPFTGEDVSSIVHQHIATEPKKPGELNPEISPILELIILKLLEKDPENRYQSATGLRADLNKVLSGNTEFILGLNDRFTSLSFRTRLVGREKEIRELLDMFDRALQGNGGLALITGEAGSGKTRLSEEFCEQVLSRDGIFIEGRSSGDSIKPPYESFSSALDSYLTIFRNHPEQRKTEITEILREEFATLGEIINNLNPGMELILGECPALVSIQSERESERFHTVISKFFIRISDIEGGLAILTDNIQWADEGSLKILSTIMDDIQGHPLMILGTCRDQELGKADLFDKYHKKFKKQGFPHLEINLQPFTEETMNHFISSLIFEKPKKTETISKFIQSKSNGNPFFAIEILKQLVQENVLQYKKTWEFNEARLKNIEVSDSIVSIILKRMDLLTEKERDLLSLTSVIGDTFDFKFLFELSDIDETEILRIIERAVELHLLVMLPAGGISFVHERIREAFYTSLEDTKRKKFHIIIAEAIEREESANMSRVIYDVAHHYIEAGDRERAIVTAYPAGITAMKNFANEEALRYFQLALQFMEQEDLVGNVQWINILSSMSKIYLTIGKYEEAIEILLTLINHVKTQIEKAKVYQKICSAYFKIGNFRQCNLYGIMALDLLGEKLPESKITLFLDLLKEYIIHLTCLLLPWIPGPEREDNWSIQYRLITKIYATQNWSFFLSDKIKFVRSVLRVLNIGERKIGHSRELAGAIAGYGALLMTIPVTKSSQKYLERSLLMRRKLQDQWGIAQSLQWIGFSKEWMGEFKKSLKYLNVAAQKFKIIGDNREHLLCVFGIVYNHFLLSDYTTALKLIDQIMTQSEKSQDFFSHIILTLQRGLCLLILGNNEEAETCLKSSYSLSKENEIDIIFCAANVSLGILYFEKDKNKKAAVYLNWAKKTYEQRKYLKQYFVELYPFRAVNAIAAFEKEPAVISAERKEKLRAINKMCLEALRHTKQWNTHHGKSLLAYAKYNVLAGKKKKAERLFGQSIMHNRLISSPYWEGRANYEYGLFLFQQDNLKKATKTFESAYRIFSDIGAMPFMKKIEDILGISDTRQDTTSIKQLVDKERLSAINKIAQEISHIPEIDTMLTEILGKSIELTGAQRGSIFIAEEDGNLIKRSSYKFTEPSLADFTQAVAEQVHQNGAPILLDDAQKEQSLISDAIDVPGDVRSVICVPIKERQKITGICYLDNPLSSGVFTDKEANLLDSLLSRLAYAIEIELLNARIKSSGDKNKKSPQESIPTKKIKKAVDYINENYSSDISREGIAAMIDIHPDNLGKYFKVYLGKKMNEYINELRVQEAAHMLKETDEKVIDIAFSVGFQSVSTFNRTFIKLMKVTPVQYRG